MLFDNTINQYLLDKPEFLAFSFWGSVFMLAAVLLILFLLVLLRINYLLNSFRRKNLEEAWSEVFRLLRAGEEPESFPILSRGEKPIFLEFWLENRKLANGRFASMLDELARRVALERTILGILHPGKIEVLPNKTWLQGLAIAAIEYVDTEETRSALLRMTASEDLYLVVAACTTLAKLRVTGFEKEIIQTMFRFPANAPEIFARVSQAGGSEVLHVIQPFLNRLPHHTIMNFLSLAEESHDDSLVPILLYRLENTANQEEIAALLRALSRFDYPGLREAVLPYLDHENLYIRIQAAKAIGRLGNEGDINKLLPLLSEQNWWLRYRAARAICKLNNMDRESIETVSDKLSDQFAKDIIEHAYEELNWCST